MSSQRPKLISLDAFAKTVEDARIKTASGGIITLLCIFVALFLIRNEYIDYTTVIARPELVVDRDINKQLDINLDISFLNLPCDLVSIDLFDESGDLKLDIINSQLEKFRIIKQGHSSKPVEIKDEQPALQREVPLEQIAPGLPEGQTEGECGSCYGAVPQDKKQYCCNTCAAVRRAYAEANWQFFDGENIAQCEQEGYVQRLKQRIGENEGCRVKGTAKINRISGTMDFAPGASMTKDGRHVHDLSLYQKYKDKFNFDHVINHLSFGNNPPASKLVDTGSITPLDGHKFLQHKKYHSINYFLKIVATRFESLDGKHKFDTNQFSVITHDRPLAGGKDEDHQHTLHARGGVPGVAFNFDISPLKIINREEYARTRSGFILGVVSSIAGVLMVGSLMDRSVFAAQQAIKGKKDL
ncbi:Endoplasmic reticulum vesicle transporter family protein [Candida parapsilosis]|uniref:Endoplasmic reticulum-Golgi intermediate compartment protein n=1 Tax=Candida parapsilosis TaxID=5480 RepID=A0A8X7T8H2_CANPA|nr:Endoplasmic reticulum vesicle transporter family protein [Candida parapsilosis]KAF6047841.1 Endoplasmic reticulum vesicle transporter family protein [Candida parapsilosis]KAF6050191.1 Endoplasmic reticulum vesicle transporter family protein [Candida parapsilosis]KAF6061311.1 Endoplasmic reticulum vesicle transporter family protein [Candida parapsilosis]